MTEFDSIMLDTTAEAARVYYAALRQMTPQERLRRAFELSDYMRAVLRSGVRHRHPDYDREQVRLATIRLWLQDDDLFREVYPGVEVQP